MKKVRVSMISFFIILVIVIVGYKVYANDKKNKEISELRFETKVLMELDYKIQNIESKNKDNILLFIENAKKEREEKLRIKNYILNNTVFIKNDDSKLNKKEDFSGEFIILNKADKVIIMEKKDDLILVKQDYYDENSYWIKQSDIVNSLDELIKKKYPNVDYSYFEKINEYEDNPRVKVKGVYLTGYSAATTKVDKLIKLAKETNINTFVIDVKDDNGNLLFYSEAASKLSPVANKVVYVEDIEKLISKLKENNIYLIARIVTFKSPRYAKEHKDRAITYKNSERLYVNNGMIWSSPYDRNLWKYNVEIAKDAAKLGFNEIQFDYVRFPASGGGKLDKNLDYKNNLNENKPEVIQKFLKYAYNELSPYHVYISADVFGWATSTTGDVGIGQQWEALTLVLDYISPMIYPSHYGNGNYGLSVPDAFPYETMYRALKDAIDRNKNIENPAIIRPWIQDFTASWVEGHIRYTAKEVKLQIDAINDSGLEEYIVWNPSNSYHKEAFK